MTDRLDNNDETEENTKRQRKTKEEEGTMAVAKPNTRAFLLRAEKVDQFVKQDSTSRRTMERFQAHRPKAGVKTPFKERHE